MPNLSAVSIGSTAKASVPTSWSRGINPQIKSAKPFDEELVGGGHPVFSL